MEVDAARFTGVDRRVEHCRGAVALNSASFICSRRTSVARLIYSAIASLDGYIADDEGKFDWAEPDEEIHRFVNDLERPVGTYLYGRRMYETMAAWETMAPDTAYARDFAQLCGRPTRSSTRRPSRAPPRRARRSSGPSTPSPYANSRRRRRVTSPWAAPTWPARPSPPASSTRSSCSSRP